MSIGNNIKRLRTEKKISPDFIAKQVGKSGRQWIYDLEKGKIKRLAEEDIQKIASILSVSVDELRATDQSESQESFEFYNPPNKELEALQGYKDKYHYLLEENRKLWKENSVLKGFLLRHNINIYNTDNENDTL